MVAKITFSKLHNPLLLIASYVIPTMEILTFGRQHN